MTRRPFNRTAFLAGYRAACMAADIDPATGNPNTCADAGWWKDYTLWQDPGPAHSSVEAQAIANLAAETRRIAGVEHPRTFAQVFGEVFLEGAAERRAATIARRIEKQSRPFQHELPLIELHARRGETVESVEGQRMLVPIRMKKTA